MAKLLAIHSGGDWTDAAAEYLVLPDEMNLDAEIRAHSQWYSEVYCPHVHSGLLRGVGHVHMRYITLYEWLRSRGARDPTGEELVVFDDR